MNKKGDIEGILVFVTILFLILIVGFLMIVGGAVIDWVFDESVPELTNLGQIENLNMTEAGRMAINPVNNIVQNFTWFTGVAYFIMLIVSIGFAFTMRQAPSKWLMGFYVMLMLILVMGSIFISNIYEDFYTGTDDLAVRLQQQAILSFMILYSPMIFSVIGFITGIILFSGMQQEEYV